MMVCGCGDSMGKWHIDTNCNTKCTQYTCTCNLIVREWRRKVQGGRGEDGEGRKEGWTRGKGGGWRGEERGRDKGEGGRMESGGKREGQGGRGEDGEGRKEKWTEISRK